jgi:hypothetical protein
MLHYCLLKTELDALGDELIADNDTSYLDSVAVPSGPPKEAEKEVGKQSELAFFINNHIIIARFF